LVYYYYKIIKGLAQEERGEERAEERSELFMT
jgi:hypothetical protein